MSGELDELRTQQDQSRARQELLERRQDLFDGRLAILELDADPQGAKRAVMEQGIADVKDEQRAQRALLHAVHATQSDHTKRLTSVGGRLGNVETRLGQVEEKLGNVHIGVQAILAVLDRKIDEEEPGQ
jgi:hypothetical protein